MKDKKYFLDTNIVLYALGQDVEKKNISLALLPGSIISSQVLLECGNVLKYKWHQDIDYINYVHTWLKYMTKIKLIDEKTISKWLKLQKKYDLSYWDSFIVASALQAKCKILYTEDMQDKQKIENLHIINPFL